MAIKDFRDLEIWKRGILLIEQIYKVTKTFPKEEIYGLTGQLRRAAVSIPSNIAEGFVRNSNKEYKQFLYISLGSCAEIATQLIIAARLGYVGDEKSNNMLDEVNQISKMIMSLIKKIT